jgi:hypothetical protein
MSWWSTGTAGRPAPTEGRAGIAHSESDHRYFWRLRGSRHAGAPIEDATAVGGVAARRPSLWNVFIEGLLFQSRGPIRPFRSSESCVKGGEQFFQTDRELIGTKRGGHTHRLRGGMIFPRSALDGVDDPAEGNAPGVIFLALGEHGAKAVLGDRISQQSRTASVG